MNTQLTNEFAKTLLATYASASASTIKMTASEHETLEQGMGEIYILRTERDNSESEAAALRASFVRFVDAMYSHAKVDGNAPSGFYEWISSIACPIPTEVYSAAEKIADK